jgi:acyl-CoA synthetase (AMP-forming)/AMP-acid ligase II
MNMTVQDHLGQDFGSYSDLLRLQAAERPGHPALVLGGETLDYAALDGLADRIACGLQRAGLAPGAVVGLCAATGLRYVATLLGCLRAGVAFAPLSPTLSPAQRQAMLANAGAALLFADADLPADPGDPRRIAFDDDAWFAAAGTPAPVQPQPGWVFNLIYSSGTTGLPKGIAQPWSMRWAHLQRAAHNGYGPDAVTLSATPLYSNTTLVSVLPTLALGGTVVLMRKFDAGAYLALAERHRATHAILVPVQYQRLLDCPDFDARDLSSFRMKFCTGAPFKATLKAEVLRRWPGGLIESYGMTEGGGRCELPAHLFPHKLHTVGRPVEGHDIRVIDDAGTELPQGASGEIVGHAPAMMQGYHGMPERTRDAEWFDASGKRFLRTGDIGRFDADGFLVLGDRKKDMIISGGFNLYPCDIEAELNQHPAVAESAVVGVPSRKWGETPVAFAVARPGVEPASAQALQQWVNARVGKTQRLADLQWTSSLPRSEIGKVLKRELARQYSAAHPEDTL